MNKIRSQSSVDVAQIGVNHVKTLCIDVLFLCVIDASHVYCYSAKNIKV
jgi:hypothetical protein